MTRNRNFKLLRKIKETVGIFGIILGFIVIISISASITTFSLLEQYNHNYKTCISEYENVCITINGKSTNYRIKELYEDSKTYKIIDQYDVYHIVYKEDCEFYGERKNK